MQIRSVMTSYCLQLKSEKYWINDISGHIEAVFLKLGITTVHHKRNEMTPLGLLPWQLFRLQSLSVKKLNIPISNLLSETEGPTWNRHSSHIAFTSIIRLGVILFLLWCTFVMPSFKNTASIFPEISFIQYFSLFSCKLHDVITDLICMIEKCQYL